MTDSARAPLRAAVIGCGAIAYEHLPYLTSSPRAELVGLCDRSRALAEAAQARFGKGAFFTDSAVLLAEVRPEVVHILTPPHTHDALVRQALAAGAHVICEKPMAGTEAETASLLAAAGAAGRVLVESRNLLFNDSILALKAAIASGDLGEVRECDVLLGLDFLGGPFGDTNLAGPAVALPGGAVHDFLPHLVYLFQMLTGTGEAQRVNGVLANRSGNPRAGFDFLDALVEADGVRGRLRIATDIEPAQFRVILRGTRASMETDLYNPFLHREGEPDVGKRAPIGQMRGGWRLMRAGFANLRSKIAQHGTMHGMPRMIDAVYAALQAGAPPPITPAQMIATARLNDQLIALGSAA